MVSGDGSPVSGIGGTVMIVASSVVSTFVGELPQDVAVSIKIIKRHKSAEIFFLNPFFIMDCLSDLY